jgi:hypothetical protein
MSASAREIDLAACRSESAPGIREGHGNGTLRFTLCNRP